MKKSICLLIPFLLAAAFLFSACQVPPPTASAPVRTATLPPTPIPLPEITDTPADPVSTATAAVQPTPSSAAADLAGDPAVQAVQAYFQALQDKDAQAAAALVSNLSLTIDNLTRDDLANELNKQFQAGAQWSDLQVKEVRPLTDKIRLVHVSYNLTSPAVQSGQAAATPAAAAMDELWPVSLVNNQWRYNRNNLIDFHTLSLADQTTQGLRIKPVQLARFSDHLRLTLLVQNTTQDTIILGQTNEIMAAFTFGDQQVEAVKQRLIFAPLRTYPQVTLEWKGFYPNYPDGVSIRQWTTVKTAPWFTFNFNQ
jgi:hypothetical protein